MFVGESGERAKGDLEVKRVGSWSGCKPCASRPRAFVFPAFALFSLSCSCSSLSQASKTSTATQCEHTLARTRTDFAAHPYRHSPARTASLSSRSHAHSTHPRTHAMATVNEKQPATDAPLAHETAIHRVRPLSLSRSCS